MKEFMILLIACILIGGVGAVYGLQEAQFTIADFWQEGGEITYKYYSNLDFPETLLDYEVSANGIYSFQGNTTEGNLKFLLDETYDPTYIVIGANVFDLDPGYYSSVYGDMVKDDVIKYEFEVTGGVVDFIIWNDEQYDQWVGGNDTLTLRTLRDQSTASGTVQIPSNDTYYFTWVNWGTGTVTVQFVLSFQVQAEPYSVTFEIDPITLKDEEDIPVNLLGMDTDGWNIDVQVLIEIDEKDVYFSIIREEDLTITYNGNSTEIPCWVLEKKDFEDIYTGAISFILRGDYTIWKSKYSGVTLKSIYDGKIYDSEDTLLGMVYQKYTVETVSNVILIPVIASTSFSITDVLVFSIITFTILALLKKYKFRRRET